MTEPVIAAVEGAAGLLIQAAAKTLAPEAEQLLGELHDIAVEQLAKLETAVPRLVDAAEHESASLVHSMQTHVADLLAHLRGILGINAAAGEPVGPTSAAPAPQP